MIPGPFYGRGGDSKGRGEVKVISWQSVFFSGSESPDNCNLWFWSRLFSVLLEGRACHGE